MVAIIAITGAEGFIGSHLVEKLVRQNFNVRALVQYNSFNHYGWLDTIDSAILKHVEVTASDIRDPFAMNNFIKGADVVIHLAALIAIPYSYIAPQSYVDTNIQGTLNILEAAKYNNVEHFIHTSTSEVYGTARYVPIDEMHPKQPQSPYSASKIGADAMALSYYHSFSMPVTILRPFNTYGPRQSTRAVIPTIITQLLHGDGTVQLGAVKPTRDLNFVLDVVEAFNKAIKNTNIIGDTINIGSNMEISIHDLAYLIAKIMGKDLTLIHDDIRDRPKNSEVERLWCNNQRAQSLLQWQPNYGGNIVGLTKGLTHTVNWFSNPDNLQFYQPQHYTI